MALTISDVAPDPVLTEIVQEHGVGGGFAQDEIMPTRTVARNDFKYMRWAMRDFIQGSQFDSRRAPGDTAKRAITPEGSWLTGTVHERTLKDALPDEIMANAANQADYEAAIVRKLTNALRLEIENELEAALTTTGGSIVDATPSVKWDAASGVTIEKNIDAAKAAFVLACGFEPNVMILPPLVRDVVKRDATIRDLRKYTEADIVKDGALPDTLFGLKLVTPGAIEDTANPGASASISRVWNGDNVVLMYVDMSAATDPTAMTAVTRFTSAANTGSQWAAYNWRDPDPSAKTSWYRVETFDDIIVTADCAYILSDVLT